MLGVKLCKLSDKCYVKAKFFRSQKKNKKPHELIVHLDNSGGVREGYCTCGAGAVGYCNHTLGLLYLLNHTLYMKASSFPSPGTCTDNPQKWQKPRTAGIASEPIMVYTVMNPKYREHSSEGIQCTLYDVRGPIVRETPP